MSFFRRTHHRPETVARLLQAKADAERQAHQATQLLDELTKALSTQSFLTTVTRLQYDRMANPTTGEMLVQLPKSPRLQRAHNAALSHFRRTR